MLILKRLVLVNPIKILYCPLPLLFTHISSEYNLQKKPKGSLQVTFKGR